MNAKVVIPGVEGVSAGEQKGRPAISEDGTGEKTPAERERRARKRDCGRGQRETMVMFPASEHRRPNGQSATRLAREYDADPATAESVRSRHQGRLEKRRETRWEGTSRPRKEKYRKRDVTGDNEAGSNPLEGVKPVAPTQIGHSAQVDVVLMSTSCNGNEQWSGDRRNGEKGGVGAPPAIPTLVGKHLTTLAKAKGKGSRRREPSSPDGTPVTERTTELTGPGREKKINGGRMNGGVIPSEMIQPSNPKAQYNRPRATTEDAGLRVKEVTPQQYFRGFQTWVRRASLGGGDGKLPKADGASYPNWEQDRLTELWGTGYDPPELGEGNSQREKGVRSGSLNTDGQLDTDGGTRTHEVAVLTASVEDAQRKKDDKGKKPGGMWNLKGRSIDDILTDLEILKNDPDLPMPIIEADPASIEDFEQYIKGLPIIGDEEGVGEEADELMKDKESLSDLQRRSGYCYIDLRPEAFPEDLWPYVMNDQKPLVRGRWNGYDQDTIGEEVAHLLTELKVSPERQYAQPYFRAQALANLDRLLVKGKDKITPMIHSKYTHKMELIPGARPRKELPQRFSETQNAFLKAKLAILEKEGRIIQKEGLEKSDWLHRLVIVENGPKMAAFRLKYGNNVQEALNNPDNSYEVSQLCRLTVDCREINKCLVVEPYPMPDLNIGKENIIGSRYLSTSDAADAFYTVPIREEDYGKTTVAALGKQWAFKVMLQGGINSARHYARVIVETFDGIPKSKILPYQDDALVHGKDLSSAINNQQLLYDCIRPNNIMLKPSKTRIGYSSTKFLGDIYTSAGRLPDPARVESILRMEGRPKTLKEVRHIVGLLVWNIEFIPNGMGILSYLTDLMRKDVDIAAEWKEEVHGKAILQLKAALASPPCLRPIDVARPFRVHVDACKNGRGIGAVLLQEHFGQWRPCSYFSRALTPAQRQWSATELEAHALVCAARHWERYLQNGHQWTAIVDHKALIYLVVKRTKTNNTRLLNSVMYLQGHYFDILHRSGEEHFDADAVSRILQSGDIDEALQAADMDEPDDKEVTMKDLKNLNTLLKLQLAQHGYLRKSKDSGTGVIEGQAYGATLRTLAQTEDTMSANEAELLVGSFSQKKDGRKVDDLPQLPLESMLEDDEMLVEDTHAQVNMTATEQVRLREDRAARREAWNAAREKGLKEAQAEAETARVKLSEKRQLKRQPEPVDEGEEVPQIQEGAEDNDEESQEEDDEEDDQERFDDEGYGLEEGIEDRYKGVQDDPQRILLQTGPHRWTPATMNEYVNRYIPLEGKLWVHPRTRRLYQITNVFFYEKYNLVAAYSRVRDGGQPDPTDQYPHRIDGTLGLAELVAEFEKSGGSQGTSRTRWPKSEEEWAVKQVEDKVWGPVIAKLKAERDLLLSRLPVPPTMITAEERKILEDDRKKVIVYGKERGRVLLYDGVLRVEPLDKRHPNLQYVVPADLQQNVIELYHDSMGHPGAARTSDTARLSYWWHGMVTDIEEYVKKCKACARRKAYNNCAAVPIQEYDSPTMPWQRAHIDVAGKLTTTHNGNEYVLVIKDALTRFVETVAMKTKSAEEVARAFIQSVIYKHGAVQQLISDNGGEFDNKLWAQVTQLLQIQHSTTSPYNPRANGLAENHMRTLKDAISIYCDESQKDWDEHLAGTTMSYNTTVNSQTGYTPYYMMYGREARLPSETWLRHFTYVQGIRPYVQELVKGLVRVWDEVGAKKHDQVVAMQKGQRPIHHLKYYDFREGEYTMVCIMPKTRTLGWIDTQYRQINLKLQPRYAGPYLVKRKLSPVTYVLEVDGTEKVFHAVNMKPYQGKKDALTPFVEPGYERIEAGLMRKPEKPLLLSPDEDLNKEATTKYKRKKTTAKQQITKAVNAAHSKAMREEQAKQLLSHSQSEDVWILVDSEAQDPDEDDEDYGIHLEADNSATTLGFTQNSPLMDETYMSVVRGSEPIDQYTQGSEEEKGEEHKLDPVQCSLILKAAHIDENGLHPTHKELINCWILEIVRKEGIRRNLLPEQAILLEREIATDNEYVGWILRQYEDKWVEENLGHKDTDHKGQPQC